MKIAVVGIGTAGVVSLAHLLANCPEEFEIYSVYDPNTPILGIGESTTIAIPQTMFEGTRFTLLQDGDELDATIKHGVKYTGWRQHDILSHIQPPARGMHFNNFKIKDFSFKRFYELWGNKFKEIQGNVTDIVSTDSSAVVTIDDKKLTFDYVVDCRGYPTDYSEYTMADSIPVNHCLVHMIPEQGTWEWTYHVAHRNGWMFGIPLKTRQGWGYLYNDTITSKEDAMSDIAERFNVKVEDLNLREFKFKSYYTKNTFVGRVIKNGNRALFFEPLEAMSGTYYNLVMQMFMEHLKFNRPHDDINATLYETANDLETFISYIYHGGSTYDSDFWTITKEKTSHRLSVDKNFKNYMNFIANEPNAFFAHKINYGLFNSISWRDFEKNFGYNYIEKYKIINS